MMTFSDKEIKKIYLGDKKIWEEGAGEVSLTMVEDAIAKGDTETLHILYQADPKKAIKESDTALEMLAEAYPEFYAFIEFPGVKLNRFDLPSEDTYFGPVENDAFGTFVGGSEDGKAFDENSLVNQLSLPKSNIVDHALTWHCIYDAEEKQLYYIPNDYLYRSAYYKKLKENGFLSGKYIATTEITSNVVMPSLEKWEKYVCGLADGTYAHLSDSEMGFYGSDAKGAKNITDDDGEVVYRFGPGGKSSDSDNGLYSDSTKSFRPFLVASVA